MKRRTMLLGAAGGLLLAGAGGVAFATGRTPQRLTPRAMAPVSAEEHARTIEAMRPPKRARPVVAVVGQNDGSEVTDYIIPYAVLKQSDTADVMALATERRPLQLAPALRIEPQATTSEFDDQHPDGADFVIVPALHTRDHPHVVNFVQAQASKGATIVGVCAGTKTLSAAGLLVGRRATGHWYDIEDLMAANPTMELVRDRRYVADRGVVTTTGVSASLPVSLALVEAIAGIDRARSLAASLGCQSWDELHDSSAFSFTANNMVTSALNRLSFWNRDTWFMPLSEGMDDIALAFTVDPWSRTNLSRVRTVADGPGITTMRGLRVLADQNVASSSANRMLPLRVAGGVSSTLPANIDAIAERYGPQTATLVALQLEYPWASTASLTN